MYCYIDDQKFDEARKVMEEMHQLEGKNGFDNIDVEVNIFTSTHLAELVLWEKKGEHKLALVKINTIISGFAKMGDTINKENKLLFNYHIANIYFGAGEYKDALHWINNVLNENEQSLRQDIHGFARMINLIVHYELGNHDLLEYIIKSTLRFLNKKEKDYKVESVIVKHLRKLVKTTLETERRDAYQKMKMELEELFENPMEKVLLDYFDVLAWLDSKILNISFTDSVRKRKTMMMNPFVLEKSF
jgi:tetratricopeptide (TPR) repeat protein